MQSNRWGGREPAQRIFSEPGQWKRARAGQSFVGRRGPGKWAASLSSFGRKSPLQDRGVLALRERLCSLQSRASKVAPQNRTLPILSLWITHRDRVVFIC